MLFTLDNISQAVIIILASCFLSLVPYFLARKLLLSKIDEHSKEFSGSVIFRVGALHSLILALVFAQELLNFNEARHTASHEAVQVGNVFYDLTRYGEGNENIADIMENLISYSKIVINDEWSALANNNRLDSRAWEEWESAYLGILDLTPQNTRQTELKRIMLSQIREVSELRLKRENSASIGTNKLFLFAAVAGIIIISIGYFAFPPTVVNLTLLTIFGVYTGFVIYFILAFSNPFSGAGYIDPSGFERLYEGMLKHI